MRRRKATAAQPVPNAADLHRPLHATHDHSPIRKNIMEGERKKMNLTDGSHMTWNLHVLFDSIFVSHGVATGWVGPGLDRNSPASDSRLLHPPYPRCSKQGKISPYPASGPLGTRTQPGHRMDAASRWEASSSGWYAEKHMGGDTGENGIDKTLIGDVMLQHRQEAANETPQGPDPTTPRVRKQSRP
uniref:Uncharacterized protein n=1 Tax=Oryza nivara TaxID=4536 RepID=A0A0E0G461_ORYNI